MKHNHIDNLITDKPLKLLSSVQKFSVKNSKEVPNFSPSKAIDLIYKLNIIYTRLGIDNFRNKYTLVYGKRGSPHVFQVFDETDVNIIATIIMHKDNSIEVKCNKFSFHAKNITYLRNNYSVDYLNNDLTWHINN